MNYLLDTHVWLWGVGPADRIPASVRKRLSDDAAHLWLAPLSVHELLQAAAVGRLSLSPDPATWIGRALAGSGVSEAPLTFAIAAAANDLELPTRDPADRLLVATARVRGFTPVTADRLLAGLTGVDLLAFRPEG